MGTKRESTQEPAGDLPAWRRPAILNDTMATEGPLDKKTIGVVALAISAFVVLGVVVAVFGAPEEPTPVLAKRATTTTEFVDSSAATRSSSTTTATAPEMIEIDFEPVPGLGFERERSWTYDVETQVLENVVVFKPDREELLVAYREVLPSSLLDLGDFEFDPLTDDVTAVAEGSRVFRFEVPTSASDPGELRWSVTTEALLTADELAQLADDRNEAEAAEAEVVELTVTPG